MEKAYIPRHIYIQLKIIVRDAVVQAFQEFEKRRCTNPEIPNDDFLSAEQAAKYLKIKLNTLYAKVEKGEVLFYRSGKRKLLFSKTELTEYIKNHKG